MHHETSDPPVAGRQIDWPTAAELLAAGCQVSEVARRLGCSRSQVSRKRNHNPVFRRLIESHRRQLAPFGTDRDAPLRQAVHQAIEGEVKNGNVRVILWLADRLKLMRPLETPAPEAELHTLLQDLSQEQLAEFAALAEER